MLRSLLPLLTACAVPAVPGPTRDVPDTGAVEHSGAPQDSAAEEAPLERVGGSLVRFDPPSGLVDAPFTLTLSTDAAGAGILYTLDGSDPLVSETAQPYAAPLTVERTTALRAALELDGAPVGPVSTGSWIFLDQVAEQAAPAGWPETWFEDYGEGPYEAHYGMEEDVVAPDPAALLLALEALPVLSLVLAPDALWGPAGIYDHAWEEGEDWERPVHVELLNSARPWAADAGLRAYGGASRTPSGTPKKTFRLIFRSEYGPAELEAALWGEEVEEINGFILRSGYNNTWVHWDPDQRARGQQLHDPYARATQRELGWAAPRGLFVHLFLNGVYWGVHDLTERPDARFFAAAYGAAEGSEDPEGWDALNSGEAIDGDTAAWEEALALARAADGSDESLARLEAVVDADALIDYMLLNFWAGNVDWPYHNWYAGRAREGGRWRFVSWDAEHTLERADDDVTGVSDAGTPAELWSALLRHPDFLARVRARAAALLDAGGALGAEAAVARYEALAEQLRPGMLAESARWGSYRRDVYCYAYPPCPLYTMDDWEAEHERLTGSLLPGRVETVQAQLAARGWWSAP